MKRNVNLTFFDISSDLEELPENELFKLKGANSDDIDGGELDEVVIDIPEEDDDSEQDPWPGEEEEEPYPWENEDPDYDNDGTYGGGGDGGADGDSDTDEDEKEPECTCEIGLHEPGEITEIKDPDGLLSGLKSDLASKTTLFSDMLDTGAFPPAITRGGIESALAAIADINSLVDLVENSTKGYRFEIDGNSAGGSTSKDVTTGEYVVRIDKAGDYGLLIHELVHISQIQNGMIGFDSNGQPTMVGLEDEIQAYQMQYNYDAGGLQPSTATAQSIKSNYPGMYDNLPMNGGGCPVHG